MAVRFKGYVFGSTTVGFTASNPAEGMDICLLCLLCPVTVVIPSMGRFVVQGVLPVCVRLIMCDIEALTMRRTSPIRLLRYRKKKRYSSPCSV